MSSSGIPSSLAALLPSPPTTYRTPKGTIHLWESKNVLVTCVEDLLTVEAAQAIETATRRLVSRGGSHIQFHDWHAMTDYDSAARARLTTFAIDRAKNIAALHMFASVTVVRLAVKAASLAIRNLRMHDERGSFDGELRRALEA